ncbi:MAG: HEPN domain-containing protein [Candidatus Sumerlaeota bacterium]|nr:HEPN domain-containing protein [Candidatus Sumerlaeota bacterium]
MTPLCDSPQFSEFEAGLDQIVKSLDLVRVATDLRPYLNDMLRWECLEKDKKGLAQKFIKTDQPDVAVFCRAFYVMVYALLEKLMADMMRIGVEVINSRAKSFASLRENFQHEHIHRSAIALQTIKGRRDHHDFDFFAICRNLGSCLPESDQFTLNATAFAMTDGGLTSENVPRLLRRIGIDLDWDDFGRSTDLQGVMGRSHTRETAGEVKAWLDKMTRNRNRLAHTGGVSLTITERDLRDALAFAKAFGHALADVIESGIGQNF